MIAVNRPVAMKTPKDSIFASRLLPNEGALSIRMAWTGPQLPNAYLRLRLAPLERFFAPELVAALPVFLDDFRVAAAADFLVDALRPPLPKILVQLSEYCLVAPRRRMLMGNNAPFEIEAALLEN